MLAIRAHKVGGGVERLGNETRYHSGYCLGGWTGVNGPMIQSTLFEHVLYLDLDDDHQPLLYFETPDVFSAGRCILIMLQY